MRKAESRQIQSNPTFPAASFQDSDCLRAFQQPRGMLIVLSGSKMLTTLSPSEWRLRGLRVGSPFSWTAASRFDALRLSFDGLRMVNIVEPLKALSLSKGTSRVRLGETLALQRVPAK